MLLSTDDTRRIMRVSTASASRIAASSQFKHLFCRLYLNIRLFFNYYSIVYGPFNWLAHKVNQDGWMGETKRQFVWIFHPLNVWIYSISKCLPTCSIILIFPGKQQNIISVVFRSINNSTTKTGKNLMKREKEIRNYNWWHAYYFPIWARNAKIGMFIESGHLA